MKEYIVCFISNNNDSDFTDLMTFEEAKKCIKKYKKDWAVYYLTKILK
jgi:hypothetical protein